MMEAAYTQSLADNEETKDKFLVDLFSGAVFTKNT